MFYTINNLKYSLFNKINATLKKRSSKITIKKERKRAKRFKKIHAILWTEFMLIQYLSGDEYD
jgi:hypothetical protein